MATRRAQTVQQWGSSLLLRIPAAVARAARLKVGQPVQVSAHDSTVVVVPVSARRLTLAQKLTAFDPATHGEESMATRSVGSEALGVERRPGALADSA
jgi:antitoxin MazE